MKKILVVEDVELNRDLIVQLLDEDLLFATLARFLERMCHHEPEEQR